MAYLYTRATIASLAAKRSVPAVAEVPGRAQVNADLDGLSCLIATESARMSD